MTQQAVTESGARTTTPEPSVILPGNYDGVHLGHRALLRTANAYARANSLATCVLTFDPHPSSMLGNAEKPVLTLQPRRAQLLRAAGADRVFVQHFTPEFASLSPEAFVDALLAQGARALVVGPDFRFGKMRAGDVDLLRKLAEDRGFSILIEQPVMLDGERVSSSAVRAAIASGNVLRATKMLGRVHEVQGKVVAGNRRGRSIGFPTANIDPDAVIQPSDGVYAVMVHELGVSGPRTLHAGVANLGTRPTFEAGRSLEVHLFDFQRDIYDAELRVGFAFKLRGEQRFAGVEELKRQIALDCDRAREMLRAATPEWMEQL